MRISQCSIRRGNAPATRNASTFTRTISLNNKLWRNYSLDFSKEDVLVRDVKDLKRQIYASKSSIIGNALRAQPSLKVKVFYLGVASLSLSFLDTLESHQGDFDRGLSGQRSLSERDINDICKLTTNSFLRLYIK